MYHYDDRRRILCETGYYLEPRYPTIIYTLYIIFISGSKSILLMIKALVNIYMLTMISRASEGNGQECKSLLKLITYNMWSYFFFFFASDWKTTNFFGMWLMTVCSVCNLFFAIEITLNSCIIYYLLNVNPKSHIYMPSDSYFKTGRET